MSIIRKKKNLKRIVLTSLFFLIASILFLKFWAQGDIIEYNGIFTESFNDTNYKDEAKCSVARWGEGFISLRKIGGNFEVGNPAYIPIWINTLTTNDFDLDGWPDFVGSSSDYSNVLAFVRNMGVDGKIGTFEITHWIDGSQGSGGMPTLGVKGQAIDRSGHLGMTSGDYDKDGDYDFLFMVSQLNNPYTFKRIWLYKNCLIEDGYLHFTQIDMTSSWSSKLKGIAWTATMMTSLDFDKDGDIDILVGCTDGKVRLLRNTNNKQINSSTFYVENSFLVDSGWSKKGSSTVSCADFDSDGDLDIMVGSVYYPELRYYKNDGTGNFSLYKEYKDTNGGLTDNEYDGAASVSICDDFDMDGDPDLMIGPDNWNYNKNDGSGTGYGGTCFHFKNNGGEFSQKLIFDDRPTVFDFDLGAAFDFDKDGDLDFLMADGNHSEAYYLFVNELADVYCLEGRAVSTNLTPEINSNLQAITRVQIKKLEMRTQGGSNQGLTVKVYLSNNDGKNWEFYQEFHEADIKNYGELSWHTFEHFGSQLRWKAVLTATEDEMEDYEGASFETPVIDEIQLEYVYVDRREYSRTSVPTVTLIDDDDPSKKTKAIIAGTFIFPGWEGHLRAYDLTSMPIENTSYSALQTISRSNLSSPSGREIMSSGVEILWDAGEILNSTDASKRKIYTAYVQGEEEQHHHHHHYNGLTRIDFDTKNQNLEKLEPILQDFNGDNEGLINFVRGEGRDWKLGDIDHSNPIVVGPPDEDSALMGEGYAEFKNKNKTRKRVLYVGTNDGMLHCFDIKNGEELWGFIPYNLLPKLKNMWAVDPESGTRYFSRDVYVDGSPAVADVKISGDWKTILICGQGAGKGSTVGHGINYYFALDVTNPNNPEVLWEFTDEKMGETWSVPAIGKVNIKGNSSWVAFMGSGYDNDENPGVIVGNVFYAINVDDGTDFWSFEASDINTSPNIPNTIPASPAIVALDQDGYADRVYVADLDGRIWKVNVSVPFDDIAGGGTTWDSEVTVIYQDPNNYPILCKPACWVNASSGESIPHLYFGTGGDDRAPSDATYSFISLMDGATAGVEWYIGDPGILSLPPEKDKGDLGPGEKVWADPVIGDYIVYFSTLTGSIESVDPTLNLAGLGKLYARAIRSFGVASTGETVFSLASGAAESLNLASKSRSAVTLGARERTEEGIRKREVYIHEYDSTIQKLEQLVSAVLEVKSWREVYIVQIVGKKK